MLTFSFSNGLWKAKRGDQVLGQAKTLETLLKNAGTGELPDSAYFYAAEAIYALYGDTQPALHNEQIQTREP